MCSGGVPALFSICLKNLRKCRSPLRRRLSPPASQAPPDLAARLKKADMDDLLAQHGINARDCSSLSEKFEQSRRRDSLPWSHSTAGWRGRTFAPKVLNSGAKPRPTFSVAQPLAAHGTNQDSEPEGERGVAVRHSRPASQLSSESWDRGLPGLARDAPDLLERLKAADFQRWPD